MKKFCVIGALVTSKIDRTWFQEQGPAEEHGSSLARKGFRDNGGKPMTLYVVEVKKVIEVGMPTVEVRDPTDTDAAEAGAEDDQEADSTTGRPAAKTSRTWRRPR